MKNLLQLSFIPQSINLALLILRLWLGLGLFCKHGIEKFTHFSDMAQHFPDPLHLGSSLSLTIALISDGICSLLIMLGLATRLASLFVIMNVFIVFLLFHHFSFGEEHAEIVYLYLGGFLAIFIAGAGKYSLDQKLLKTTD